MSDPRCPYCHSGFERDGDHAVLTCVGCGAPHHVGCVGESKARRCATCGGAVKPPVSKRRADAWRASAALERTVPVAQRSLEDLKRPREGLPVWQAVPLCLLVVAVTACLGGFVGQSLGRQKPRKTVHIDVGGGGVYTTYDDGVRGGWWEGVAFGALFGAFACGWVAVQGRSNQRPTRRRSVGMPRPRGASRGRSGGPQQVEPTPKRGKPRPTGRRGERG